MPICRHRAAVPQAEDVLESIELGLSQQLAPLLWDTEWFEIVSDCFGNWQDGMARHLAALPRTALWHATPMLARPASAAVTASHGLLAAVLDALDSCSKHVNFSQLTKIHVRLS